MSEELLNKIIDKIKGLKNPRYSNLPLLDDSELSIVRLGLLTIKNEETAKIKELEVKIFVYEEIIKKSNFAPIVKENDDLIEKKKQKENE